MRGAPPWFMPAIDRFMPTYVLREVDHVAVDVAPSTAFTVARATDFYRVPFIRRLFTLRTLPAQLWSFAKGALWSSAPATFHIDDIPRANPGFALLADVPGHEIVIGSVGKFWQPDIEFVPLTPETFLAFDRPGYGKLAWSIRVDSRHAGGSWLTLDLRVGATDEAALARFRQYWLLIGRFSRAIRRGVLRLVQRDLGVVPDDRLALGGDDVLPDARFQRTHAADIEASPSQVWPWLVQIGAGRAGWYSIDVLDNAGVTSADHIIPALQHLAVGDVIPGLPDASGGFAVLKMERDRLLLLGSPSLLPEAPDDAREKEPPFQSTWSFALEPIGDDATHLVVRVRAAYEPSPAMTLTRAVMTAAHEIMEREQLRHLKQRIEAAAHA